ncbi:MAG: amylo-alpha-1,6-glucosidase [Terriglobales bacterium]
MTKAHKPRPANSGKQKPSTFRPKNARGQATNIANAIAIKDDDLFLLCENNGNLPIESDQGFGIYYHDCRFLKGYELTIAGTRPNALSANSVHGYMAEFELTNHDLKQSKGGQIKKQSLRIQWQRVIQASQLSVQELITCTNYTVEPLEFVLSFSFKADFEDVFEIRGFNAPKSGRQKSPSWHRGALTFSYDGADGLHRSVSIHISPRLRTRRRNGADIAMSLGPSQSKAVQLAIRLSESPRKRSHKIDNAPSTKSLVDRLHKSSEAWLREHCEVKSSSRLLNQVFQRSIQDLGTLRSALDGEEYFSAGLPWYGALFGRDSIIASLQTLAYRPRMAEQTLRLLAKYQGQRTDNWRDEEPGKIMHELRVGELAHLNEIPQTPYYGSVDSTPLFLILVARHANWTGDLSLFRELRPSVDRAFDWMTRYGDKTGDGYLQYDSKSEKGLGNQGWKDSGDSIVNADGSLAHPPIALVEVQGYVYLAKTTVAELYERDGDPDAAQRLRAEAHELQSRFEKDFWLEDQAVYALALQAGKKPAAVVSSNAGQALWSGIVQRDHAKKTAEQLMSQSMFAGWGVRTLSSQERRFNPLGYHLGTVWPHDNSIIVAGLRKYGYDRAASAIFSGIVHSAKHFEHYRLPEVFSGISRKHSSVPVRYPVACHPQAWAAGSVPFMIESLLGLVPKAFENRLEIVRPVLPAFIKRLDLKRLKVGKSSIDLKFERRADGSVDTHVIKVNGTVDVEISNRELS